MQIPGSVVASLARRRGAAVAVAGAAVLALCVAGWMARASFQAGLATLATAEPQTAAWAASAFAASLFASACAWHVAFAAVGSRMGRAQACASYTVGSLVNTFVPAGLGEGVRAVLFGRALPDEGSRGLTTAGAIGAVAVARVFAHLVVLSCAVLVAGFPSWLLLVPAVLALLGVMGVLTFRSRPGDSRLGRLAQAGATLVRRPSFGIRVVAWTAGATAARIAAATAVAASFGISEPLRAGLVVTATLILAAAVPITPGSIGITSGAVSLVLAQRGVPMPTALAAGVLFHALESAVSVTLGLLATPFVVRPGYVQRRVVQVAFVGAALIAVAVLGAAVVTYLPVTGF